MIAIYVRVSTEEQAIQGYSVGNQIDECIKKARTSDVLKYIDDGITGEILERPGLIRLREDIQKGFITELICYDPDRLARKLMVQLILDDEFRKKGVEIKFVNGEYANTPEGRMFFSMRGAISEFEKEKILQRTKGGKIKKAKSGKVIGNYGLYGYDYDRNKETYIINEAQAKIVKRIFDYFTEPTSPFKGINGIAKHLTEIGIPTATGKKVWHRQVVRQILMNISYTGKHPHNKWNTEGGYVRKQSGQPGNYTVRPEEEWIFVDIPSIISEEQFKAAQELLSQSRRRYTKESLNQYLLSGLMTCKECGNTMTGRKTTWWGSEKFIYSDIKSTAGSKEKGCGNYVHTHELEEAVWSEVVDILNNPEKILQYKESSKEREYFQAELTQIEKEIEKNKKGRQRLLSLVAMSEDLDLTEIKGQLEELQNREKNLQTKYNQIEEQLKGLGMDNTEELMRIAIQNRKLLENLTFEGKKEIIRSLVKQIVITKAKEIEVYLF